MKPADTPETVFRLGRRPDPWSWPDWTTADSDGTFGNRFDDPQGIYRVLYASTQRVATFLERLAYFRPDPEVLAGLQEIEGTDGDNEPSPAGVVPREWIEVRCVGSGNLLGSYVDVGHHETIAELRVELAARVVHHGLHDLDAATIRLTAPRAFTQDISRHVFDQTVDGARQWNGIAYRSKHGDDLTNWAIFEPTSPTPTGIAEFDAQDVDLVSALQVHGLTLA